MNLQYVIYGSRVQMATNIIHGSHSIKKVTLDYLNIRMSVANSHLLSLALMAQYSDAYNS